MKTQATVKPVNTVEYLKWGDQCAVEAIEWHKVKDSPKPTQAEIDAFHAGYLQAWVKAVSTLKLHGMVVGDGK